jgi:hypothetical protein
VVALKGTDVHGETGTAVATAAGKKLPPHPIMHSAFYHAVANYLKVFRF